MKKKSQAAIEFLMTHGWIIMTFLMAIAALDYFGVIDLTAVFPEKCVLAYKLACVDYTIKPSEVEIVISNDAKMPIIVNSIDVADCFGTFSTPMSSDETSAFTITNCNNGKKNDILKGEITLKYTEKRTGLQRNIYGKIKSKVRE